MTLPLLISLPHAGLLVPGEVSHLCKLTPREIKQDGDVGAAEIYDFEDQVAEFVTTEIARAIVDMNRAEDDRRSDGVIKTHTCWQVPVYREAPPEALVQQLFDAYYRPYHESLRERANNVSVGIDCHTMAAVGPPIGPDPGEERPQVCLSNAEGTCPGEWLDSLALCFGRYFKTVTKNTPFQGGYIVRSHAKELPWIQLELSRDPFTSDSEKRERVLKALNQWCQLTFA